MVASPDGLVTEDLGPAVRLLREVLDHAPRCVIVTGVRMALRARARVGSIDEIIERWLGGTLERPSFFKPAVTTLFHGRSSRKMAWYVGRLYRA